MTWNFFEIINKPKLELTLLDEFIGAMWITAFVLLCGAIFWGWLLWKTRSK